MVTVSTEAPPKSFFLWGMANQRKVTLNIGEKQIALQSHWGKQQTVTVAKRKLLRLCAMNNHFFVFETVISKTGTLSLQFSVVCKHQGPQRPLPDLIVSLSITIANKKELRTDPDVIPPPPWTHLSLLPNTSPLSHVLIHVQHHPHIFLCHDFLMQYHSSSRHTPSYAFSHWIELNCVGVVVTNQVGLNMLETADLMGLSCTTNPPKVHREKTSRGWQFSVPNRFVKARRSEVSGQTALS